VVAVAIAVIIAVVLLAAGIVVQSNTPDILSFFGVTVRTTTAQIFLTGAICTWALLAAAWLLSAGIRRSRERGEELAAARCAPVPNRAVPGRMTAQAGSEHVFGDLNELFGIGGGDRARSGDRDGARGTERQQGDQASGR
jgi:hypothetical protein